MDYKYVTDNNLENRQNYMYSEYKGRAFLQEYIESREEVINGFINVYLCDGNELLFHITRQELQEILATLRENGWDKITKKKIDDYVKSFEVRKRIYSEYDNKWKPCTNAGYEDYETYLILCEILIYAYSLTKCTKYYSCLLKLNDTMLSLKDKLTDRQKCVLSTILKKELAFFWQLVKEGGYEL